MNLGLHSKSFIVKNTVAQVSGIACGSYGLWYLANSHRLSAKLNSVKGIMPQVIEKDFKRSYERSYIYVSW